MTQIMVTVTSNKLLDAAREMLLTKNFSDITVSGIVKKAHVGQGSFYKYFSSPYEIAQVLKTAEEEKCWDSLIQYYSRTSSGTFSQKIERMTVYLVQHIRSSLNFQRIVGENISWFDCFEKMTDPDSEEQEQFNKDLYEYASSIGMAEDQVRTNIHFLFTTAARLSCAAINGQIPLTFDETKTYIRKTANRLFPEK